MLIFFLGFQSLKCSGLSSSHHFSLHVHDDESHTTNICQYVLAFYTLTEVISDHLGVSANMGQER